MKTRYLDNLPDDVKQIKGTLCWADRSGNIYGKETRQLYNKYTKEKTKHKYFGKYFKYNIFKNNHNGYMYCNIKYVDSVSGTITVKQRRVHILIAETFLDNPNNYPIVGHKNNIKSDNRVENLYWTTYKENTQKAYDDGLCKNDNGYQDSQSKPVNMYNTYTNELINSFGSCRIASESTGVPLGTITRQAKYHRPVRKPYYFRFQDDEICDKPSLIIQYDIYTHNEIARFYSISEASNVTGISENTISQQCLNDVVPKWSKSKTYFLRR